MKKLLLSLLFLSVLFAACSATQTTDTGVTIESVVDPVLYNVNITLEEETESYSTMNASVYAYNGYTRGVVWEEGKGLVRGYINHVQPTVSFASPGDVIIVKTTDRKIMGLLPGDTIELICLADYEPVCAKSTEFGETGECRDLWEFDYCRLGDIVPAQ